MRINEAKQRSAQSFEERLADELARGGALVASSGTVLRHLLANDDYLLFSEEVVARIRGMLTHVARQLLFAEAEGAESVDRADYAQQRQGVLAGQLAQHETLLRHVHALAFESLLITRLAQRHDIDGVVVPLLENCAAAPDDELAGLAMTALAAQARFLQQQKRMELPLSELPGEMFHQAVLTLEEHGDSASAARAASGLRDQFEEGETRFALLAKLVMSMQGAPSDWLSIEKSGLSLFVTLLAIDGGYDRDDVLLACSETQTMRLQLMLRAADMHANDIAAQLRLIHGDSDDDTQIGMLTPDHCRDLLAALAREQNSS
ncbi:hypothetical protein [Altericroceibacterium endophyticum]|uniref:DUF2336 domain-containing protein n=1 Tax=Altericroceibacterium endophyticum TaxID=1808508 RepID=A0A6I4T513_9SPHN|nr:hypothetical protein [Altericroceibacterium endophyticum]MXO65986.1 hypothetical protein [Altericroceibacterium endophyticum]